MRPQFTFLLGAVLTSLLYAQTDDVTRKLQIAQNLERIGEWKQATIIYEELYGSDSTNYVFFDALRRAYAQLGEYDKAIFLIEQRMRKQPAEFYLAAFLGGLAFDAGMRERADSVWQQLLANQPKQRQMYVLVAQQMQERRLFARAIDTYQKGRTAIGNRGEFAQELAMLHSATQDYGNAVAEYILMIEQTPHQLGFVQSRIASFTIREEGLRQAETVIAQAVADHPGHMQIRTLYGWVLMEQGRYDRALEVYRDLDRMSDAKGQQLFSFAGMAVREGFFREASRAYSDIIALVPTAPLRSQAMYGMAEAYEKMLTPIRPDVWMNESSSAEISESPPAPDSARSLYQRVINEYQGSYIALQSLYRIGIIQFERHFDLDGARRAFSAVRHDRQAGHLAWEALLVESDVLVANGDVEGALTLLESAPQQARSYLDDRFVLQHARLRYFHGDFGQAIGLLSGVMTSLDKDAANDALELTYHLQDGSSDSLTLIQYARAEVLSHQRKYAESLQFFQAVAENARTAMLASKARVASADMFVMLGRPLDAVALLDSVVTTYQTDVLRDRALFRVGTLYEQRLGDLEQARKAYERFIVLFPTSIYADEVRRRLRSIGRDPS